MKESEVGIATCSCRHCRFGDNRHSKKERNKQRRKHINKELDYLKLFGEIDSFIMPSVSYYTD